MSLKTKEFDVKDVSGLSGDDLERILNEQAYAGFYLVQVTESGLAIFRYKRD